MRFVEIRVEESLDNFIKISKKKSNLFEIQINLKLDRTLYSVIV